MPPRPPTAATRAFVPWLLGGVFTPQQHAPDTLATIAEALPSNGMIEVGGATTRGSHPSLGHSRPHRLDPLP
ncbi:MAG: hypothetical protein ACRDG9_13210, partial [Actinomycetota bacterium]